LVNTIGNASATNIVSTSAQYAVVRVTGTLTTPKVITFGSAGAAPYSKLYLVDNAATGSTVTFKAYGQTGVSIAAGESSFVYYNGTDIIKVTSDLITALTGTLAVANGGTGVTSSTGTGAVVLSTSPSLVTPVLGTPSSGNVGACTVDGTNLVGYKAIPQSGAAKTTSYTLAVGDVGEFIEVGASGAIVVPNATFAAGDAVVIFNNTSGAITLTMSITTAYIGGTDADKATISLATRGICNVLFISGTVCVVTGNVT
jgi:hypothetical protein